MINIDVYSELKCNDHDNKTLMYSLQYKTTSLLDTSSILHKTIDCFINMF